MDIDRLNRNFLKHFKMLSKAECWKWTAFCDKDGYGKMRVGNTNKGAHIVSFYLFNGYWPENMVLHNCHNPACVNPNHLREGTHNENMIDRKEQGNYYKNEKHPRCKYNNKIAIEIKGSDKPAKYFRNKYGISESQVGNIRRGDQRKL